MLIFENDGVQCFHVDRNSDRAVFFFNERTFRADGVSFWGQALAEKLQISAIGIVSKGPNWFAARYMDGALPDLARISGSYGKRLGYGCSMGGYAAIKYSRALGLNHTLAISPIFSIEPGVMGKGDRRYAGDYVPELHDGMQIQKADIAGSIYMAADPNFAPDLLNLEKILGAAGSASLIPAFNTDHATIRCFGSTAFMHDVINACFSHDLARLRSLTAIQRRKSAIRALVLTLRALRRRPNAARFVFDAYLERFGEWQRLPSDLGMYLAAIGEGFERSGQAEMAQRAYEKSLLLLPRSASAFLGLARLAMQNGRNAEVAAIAERLRTIRNPKPKLKRALDHYDRMVQDLPK